MTIDPIEITVVVAAPPAAAFQAFTSKIADWWPLDKHSVGAYIDPTPPKTLVLEPHLGGRFYEISDEGETRAWGHVTEWVEAEKLAVTWHPGKDSTLATAVAVTFTPTDDGKTAVCLTHSGWEVLGDTATKSREGYAGGWQGIMHDRFAGFVQAQIAAA